MLTRNLIVALLAVSFIATDTYASGTVELTAIVQRETAIVDENGDKQIELVSADKVMPGEIVVYTITAKNVGQEPATNIVITDPLPQELDYRAGSAMGEDTSITFSVDGGKSYDVANALVVVDEGGAAKPAEPEDYTHIRWQLNSALEPGSSRYVRFRARLQ